MSDLCRFLLAVTKEHTIPYDKLIRVVSDEFTHHKQLNLDPDDEFVTNTKHFNCFVRGYGFKEVNVGTVVLYLKGVKLAVSDRRNRDLSIDLKDANERQNQEISLIKAFLIMTSLSLAGFSYLL